MKVLHKSFGETWCRGVQTLPSHLMNFQWSREQKWNRGSGKHSVFTHFPKDPNCEICLKTEMIRDSCRRRAGTVVPRAAHFGDLSRRDLMQRSAHTSSSSHDPLVEPRAYVEPCSGTNSVFTHFPNDHEKWYLLEDQNNKGLLQKTRQCSRCHERKIWETWLLQITKFYVQESESRNKHLFAVVVQDLATQWLQSYPCKSKSSQETKKNLMKFLEPTRKSKVIYTVNSLAFGKVLWRIYSWNHCKSTPHRSVTRWDCWKSSSKSKRVRHLRCYCSPVWITNGGRIPWNVTAAKHARWTCLMGKTPYDRWFGMPLYGDD